MAKLYFILDDGLWKIIELIIPEKIKAEFVDRLKILNRYEVELVDRLSVAMVGML